MAIQLPQFILKDRAIRLDGLVSLEWVQSRLSAGRIQALIADKHGKGAASVFQTADGGFEAFTMKAMETDQIPLFVAHPDGKTARQIRPEVLSHGHPAFNPLITIRTGRFATIGMLLANMSLDVALQGQPVFMKLSDALRIFRLRHTSVSRLEAIALAIIKEVQSHGSELSKDEVVDAVLDHPDVIAAPNRVLNVVNRIKPKGWSRPGPRKRSNA